MQQGFSMGYILTSSAIIKNGKAELRALHLSGGKSRSWLPQSLA